MALNWLKNIFSQKHIAIVDDDRDYLELLSPILERQKYRVTAARSYKELCDVCDLEEVDLFLLDIFLKTKPNGPQIALHLRQNGLKAPICFLSGTKCSLEEENKLVMLERDCHFLPKSVMPHVLLKKVSELAH